MDVWSAWISKARRLLAPSILHCLICGANSRFPSKLPGVCTVCEEAIPWIWRPRCRTCGRHVGCPDCSRSGHSVPVVCNRSAVAYTSVMRELLGRYKYRGDEQLAPLLGQMLDKAYVLLKEEREREQYSLEENPGRQNTVHRGFISGGRAAAKERWQADLLVPVPVSDSRLAERGFNQAERLADVLSRLRGVPQLPLLVRTRHTAKQSFKSRAERLADMKHVFAVTPEEAVRQQLAGWLDNARDRPNPFRIIVIDDIYTTGSTIRACAESIKLLCDSNGRNAEIYSLTWARS